MTSSLDKSIRIYQLPIFWPSEIIRRSKNKNSKNLIQENTSNYHSTPTQQTEENNLENSDNELEENVIHQPIITANNDLIFNDEDIADVARRFNKANLPELLEKQVWCEDLDGWDNDY